MKKLVTLALITLSSLSVNAADADKEARKKEMFEKAKSMATSNIDKRISALQDTKSCISSASDKEALKKCRQKAKENAQALRKESKSRRQEMRKKIQEQRKKNRADRKSKHED